MIIIIIIMIIIIIIIIIMVVGALGSASKKLAGHLPRSCPMHCYGPLRAVHGPYVLHKPSLLLTVRMLSIYGQRHTFHTFLVL